MAPSSQPPVQPPHASCEASASSDSFFDLPHHHRRRSGSGASSRPQSPDGDSTTFSSALEEFGLPSISSDFELDTSFVANNEARGPATQVIPPTPPAVDELGPMPDIKLRNQTATARGKRSSLMERPRSWLGPSTKVAKDSWNALVEKSGTTSKDDTSHPNRSPYGPESFANFARRSWMSRSSRSPSPKDRPDLAPGAGNPGREGVSTRARASSKTKSSKSPHRLQVITTNDQEEGSRQATPLKPASLSITRATSYLSKMKPRQQGSIFGRDGPDSDHSCASSATSLNRTSDGVHTSTSRSICSDGNTHTPITDESCNEATPRLRDPLWSSFKTLDAEVKSFVSAKQTATRVARIQSGLLPFLRSTRNHPSNKTISLEDVERRVLVLNKWWSSLLEMLQGPLPQPIPGIDRPILLEAATMLMMRPEWRMTISYMQPLSERSPLERVRSRSWTNVSKSAADSSTFSQSQIHTGSAEHKIRTMFVSNLARQMAHVVDKMSLRHAPLSLVNFSGKTCAYAFFFCPGVADVLVRLWGLTPELIRRTGTELGLPRKDTGESEDIVALFPPTLGVLGWTSPRSVWDTLKKVPKMTVLTKVPWTGPWVTRWKGRDTDLFFIFCKYFHVLSDQFIPAGLPLSEKARAPAFALVHAQLLSIIDSTIHRQTSPDQSSGAPPIIDAAHGSDATAVALPLPPTTNLLKSMSENRLVILLKDFFSDDAAELSGARHTYAETFAGLIKAAARKTSLYNNAACFALCDFLEEVLMIYHEFETASTTYIDWPFWIDVCQKMASSMNTMTEVRLLSLVFTIWDALAKDSHRKASICLEWLLTEESFNTFFNNWCPMVRAYYQRLVCWRMCRYTGDPTDSEMDLEIYHVASARLRQNWAHYLYMKKTAAESRRIPPSTAPMSPAMGKKFMIIRQEANLPQKGLFMGFDTFARGGTATGTNGPWPTGGDTDAASTGSGTGTATGGDSSSRSETNKKRWSLIGKVLSMASSSHAAPSSSAASSSDAFPHSKSLTDLTGLRRELAEPATLVPASSSSTSLSTSRAKTAPSSETDSLGSSPVFDEQRYIFKFILGWQQNPGPARDRYLVRPLLPAATQDWMKVQRAPLPLPLQVRPVPAQLSNSSSSPSPSPSPSQLEVSGHRPVDDASQPGLRQSRTGGEGAEEGNAPISRTASVEEWLRNTPNSNACAFEDAAETSTPTTAPAPTAAPAPASTATPTADEDAAAAAAADATEATSDEEQTQAQRPTSLLPPDHPYREWFPEPIEPSGIYAHNATYCGRALAEWAQVVLECNIFTERRHDDGVERLCDVEVPFLGVDGFRKG
ncbi:hypothetical protein E4U24_005404 [Claviceps purpurea]|nr:hypothetical protein E4U24_005404 [Claviceps purpurea]